LVERLLCKQEVIGSIPFTSTRRVWAIDQGMGHLFGWERFRPVIGLRRPFAV
jgi:hypothetical protein